MSGGLSCHVLLLLRHVYEYTFFFSSFNFSGPSGHMTSDKTCINSDAQRAPFLCLSIEDKNNNWRQNNNNVVDY